MTTEELIAAEIAAQVERAARASALIDAAFAEYLTKIGKG